MPNAPFDNIETRYLREYLAQLPTGPGNAAVGVDLTAVAGLMNTATAQALVESYTATAIAPAITASYSSQGEAEAGTTNIKGMTPLRTVQTIDAQSPMVRVEKNGSDNTGVALNAAISAAGYLPQTLGSIKDEYLVDRNIIVTKELTVSLSGSTIKQINGANLASVATLNLTNSLRSLRSKLEMFVDGNRDNNATVTGITVSNMRKALSRSLLGVVNADIGVLIEGDVEFSKFDIGADLCGIGVEVRSGSSTPDELMLDVTAHSCDTFFKTSGIGKNTGVLRIAAEQANGYGIDVGQGWWDLQGEIRAVGLVAGGGGLKVSFGTDVLPPRVSGNLMVVGGNSVNCEWIADLQAGEFHALVIKAHGEFANGVRVNADVTTGSTIMVMCASVPATGPALRVYSATGSGFVNGLHVLPGSRIRSSGVAVDLAHAADCLIEPSHIEGSVVIASGSLRNTIIIPRKGFDTVSFVNSDATLTNHVIFRGRYTLAQLNARTDKFRGMRAEMVTDYQGAAAYFDGTRWVPEHGLILTGTVTVLAGATTGNVNHALGTNYGDSALSIYPKTSLGTATKWRAEMQTNFVVVTLDAAPGVDVTFPFAIRKTN